MHLAFIIWPFCPLFATEKQDPPSKPLLISDEALYESKKVKQSLYTPWRRLGGEEV
jgi:hypothetical protein